ncbi:MAG TPA: molybdopterin dinucleotide binding domain-containing protein, partial [Dehalococcoidia bacterium]
ARYADIVLPASTSLESEDFYRSYGHRYAQYAPRVIEPLGEARSNLWLIQQLAGRFGLDDDVFTRTPREHLEQLFAGARGAAAGIAPGEIVANGPTKLPLANPGPAITYLYSEQMEADGLPGLPEWRPDPAAPQGEDTVRWPLRLLTAPGHHQHHTAFAGVASLERKQGVPACLLHPEDAAARGIRDGDAVKLFNARGYVGLVAKVTADGQLGVAVVEGSRSRARFLAGGPLNVLTSDHLSDMGAGATYQSTWVEASLLTEAPRG